MNAERVREVFSPSFDKEVMAMKKLMLSLVAASAALVSFTASAKVYRPGLIQAKFGTKKLVTDSAKYPKPLTGLLNRTDCSIDYAYGSFMANFSADNTKEYVNPYSGKKWNWDGEYSAFCYEGEIYLHAGEELVMVGRFDDGSSAMVDGTILFDQEWAGDSGWNRGIDMNKLVTVKAAADGWHPIACNVYDWSGGKVIKDWVSGMQYNLNGCKTDPNKTEKWAKLTDPGDGSFLRFAMDESFMTLGTVNVDGDDALVDASFANVPVAAKLRVYYGSVDGGECPEAWANSADLADIPAGDTAVATYRLVGLKDVANIRLCLIKTADEPDTSKANEAFYEFSSRIALDQTAPTLEVLSVVPGYTNAELTVSLTGFGLGATKADIVAELSDSDTFEPVLKTVTVGTEIDTLGQYKAVFDEINTNAAYFVRAVATNEKGISGTSNALAFKTLLPTAAAGSFNVYSLSGDTETFTAKVTDYGDDSASATITLQCSATDDFADVFESDPIDLAGDGDLNVDQLMPVSGLTPGTTYFSRLKMVNAWGFESYTPVQQYTTTPTVVLQGIGYESVPNGFNVSVVIPAMSEENATVTLYANGSPVGSQTITAAGSYGFSVTAAGTVELKATVSYDGGSVEVSVTATKGTSSSVVAAPETCTTAETAILLGVGDTAVFPVLVGNAKYVNLSGHRFLRQNANVFTALEPGIAAVEVYGADGALAGTAVVLVKPDMQEGGRVFIYDPSALHEKWTKADWVVPGSDGKVAGPEDPKDVAFVLFREDGGNFCIDGEHTVQDIYFGRPFNSVKDQRIYGPGKLTVCGIKTKKYTRPGKLMFCSCANGDQWWNVYFGAYKNDTGLRWAVNVVDNDVEIDLGGPSDKFYPTKNSKANQVRFRTNDCLIDFVIPEGRKLAFVNGADRTGGLGDGQGWNDSYYYFSTADAVKGKGTIEFDLPGVSSVGKNFFHSFEGEIVDSFRNFVTAYDSERGGAFWSGDGDISSPGARLTLAGYVSELNIKKSVGVFAQGNRHGFGSPDSQKENGIPEEALTLNGGYLQLIGYNKGKANFRPCTYGGADDYEALSYTKQLTVAGGLSVIANTRVPGADQPINHLKADTLVQKDSGSVAILDARIWNDNQASARAYTELTGIDKFYVGNTDTVDIDNDVFPIVPWMMTAYARLDESWWVSADENGILRRAGRKDIALNNVTDSKRNVFSNNGSLEIAADKTINSLVFWRQNCGFNLGEGRTLTIASGGLQLRGGDAGIGTAGKTASGTVNFPERAYVWASSNNADKPGWIWAKVLAPKGFCLAGYGQFRLGGDQTGIDGDITVNCGTLQLGDTNGNGCTIDVPINLVGGNTKLQVNQVDTIKDLTLNLFCPGGYAPQIKVPAAGERCLKVYVDGKSLPRGTYGAPNSGAQFESEYIAAGSGFLTVRKDDLASGCYIFVK